MWEEKFEPTLAPTVVRGGADRKLNVDAIGGIKLVYGQAPAVA